MQLPPITYNDHTLFHLLRHFYSINESARDCLLIRGYSEEQINLNLVLPGSKFHPHFASDIRSLMSRIDQKMIADSFLQNGYMHYVFDFEKQEFSNGVGDLGVLDMEAVKKIALREPYLKNNRGMELWHAQVPNKPSCWVMTLVVKQQSSSDFLITAFPGLPAMPIPQLKMEAALLEQCESFWRDHVFLETEL